MNVLKKIALAAPLCIFALTTQASPYIDYQKDRIQTIEQYLHDLRSHDANHIISLFTSDATVTSNSQDYNAKRFFRGFLPLIKSASINDEGIINGIFKSMDDANVYSANFSYSWEMVDGSHSGGYCTDTFVFKNDSAKLEKVVMCEDIKMP